MGMFDTVVCHVPLPDGFAADYFQTKSLGRDLAMYEIRDDGTLWRLKDAWENEEKRIDFSGTVCFYTFDDRGVTPLAPYDPARWHEYIAAFVDGKLVGISVYPQPEDDT